MPRTPRPARRRRHRKPDRTALWFTAAVTLAAALISAAGQIAAALIR